SQFIVDLKNTKGLTIRPIVNMAGTHEFNELTFDEAFAPDDALVGQPGNGWTQVTRELGYERSGPERDLSSIRLAQAPAGAAGQSPEPRVLEAIGRLAARLCALRGMSLAVAAMLHNGEMPNLEAALIKDLGNAYERELIEVARNLQPALPAIDTEFDEALAECTI